MTIREKVELAKRGQWPAAICRLSSGWAVMGDVQPIDGYCVLLSDPIVPDVNALDEARRAQWWLDVCRLGDALLAVAQADRINYEVWGNVDRALHAHVTPRYLSEPDDKRRMTPREAYDISSARAFDPARDGDLQRRLRAWLSGASPNGSATQSATESAPGIAT